jgi:iron-sulfur cluster repair protein YtfE (RIC family)
MPNAIELLRADHEEVSALFQEAAAATDSKKKIVDKLCSSLTVHATIEEEIFYPACEKQVPGAADLLAEAKNEHAGMKQRIARIQGGTMDKAALEEEVSKLEQDVTHHVQEEQDELFPKVEAAGMDLDAVGARLDERKKQLGARSRAA